MQKPKITSVDGYYVVKHVLTDESKVQIVNLAGGKSYQTIKFPVGTVIEIKISKLPIEDFKENEVL